MHTSAALPAAPALPAPPRTPAEAVDLWERCQRELAALLHQRAPDDDWVRHLEASAALVRYLTRLDADTALYLMVQQATAEVQHYSTQHALLCAIVCDLCAQWLRWPSSLGDPLVRAALTMNLAMADAQDAMARQTAHLSPSQRRLVDGHAERSAELLADAGVRNELWLDVVRQHHAPPDDGRSPVSRLAQLLHRVDLYTAKLSRRANRRAKTPSIAARDILLGQDGQPDDLGAALLRVLGQYPPGSLVLMDSGDIGIVVRRGRKAHLPRVALLQRANGGTYLPPMGRDCGDGLYAVVRGMTLDEVRVHILHEQALATAWKDRSPLLPLPTAPDAADAPDIATP